MHTPIVFCIYRKEPVFLSLRFRITSLLYSFVSNSQWKNMDEPTVVFCSFIFYYKMYEHITQNSDSFLSYRTNPVQETRKITKIRQKYFRLSSVNGRITPSGTEKQHHSCRTGCQRCHISAQSRRNGPFGAAHLYRAKIDRNGIKGGFCAAH